jgi:hypothetical protein
MGIEEIGFILHVMSYITQVFGLKWLLLLFGVREREMRELMLQFC